MNDTIFALSSGAGMAGVAVVRLSGGHAGTALRRLTKRDLPPARRLCLRELRDPEDGEVIDQALVVWMPGPGSFTGENVVEFHIHGGRACVRRLLDALGKLEGLRMAEAGEFTRRAFENGRMTLMEVEGLADLIHAETESQRRQALAAASGLGSRRAEGWRDGLVSLLSRLEAVIDFSDEEDVSDSVLSGLGEEIDSLVKEMRGAWEESRRTEALREGVRVVIAGPPNAGKSSLLNALARREAAIVSHEEGTTRDVIEVRLDLGGIPVLLSDTAGLREGHASDAVERIGQERAQDLLRRADLVLWVEAPDVESTEIPHFDSDVIRILNKSDLVDSHAEHDRYDRVISVRKGAGLEELEKEMEAFIRARHAMGEPALITRERQRQALLGACEELEAAARGVGEGIPPELMAEHLRLAMRALERLIGRVDVEDLLDSIFSSFCIGK